jgi:glycosylphosphatidylinositol transamidase (GPIT) subunit GPI8
MNVKEKIIVFKFNDDGTEERIGGTFDSDIEALKAINDEGSYIFYKAFEVTKENIAELASEE